MRMRATSGFALLFVSFLGCSSSDHESALLPTEAQQQAYIRVANIFAVPVTIDGTTAILGVDTGDPFLLLNPSAFPTEPAVGTVASVDAGTQHFSDVPVITSSQSPAGGDAAVPLGGLLGCPVLCNTISNFNYRDFAFTLGSTPAVDGLLPEIQLDFAFEGGGEKVEVSGSQVTVPVSRIVVTVDLEGTPYKMIVDTGASAVSVSAAAFAALTADGRTQLTAGELQTASGTSIATYTRAKTVGLGAAQASGIVVLHDDSFDTNLATISSETGETIDGSLGGTFLEHFDLTIDYPNRTLRLAPYQDTSFIVDPAELVGFSIGTRVSTGYAIASVFSGSDAETKGVSAGDIVTAIDGQSVAPLSLSQMVVLLSGPVGSTKSVTFGAAKSLANQTVDLAVEELLPLPK